MKHKRPINLNLFTIKFPITAIVSILHRLSGLLLFILIPFLLWGLNLSLSSQQDFDALYFRLTTPWSKFIIWLLLSAFIYHFVAGIRHLIMDAGIGEGLKSGRLGAILVLVISVILTLLAGIWLW